MIVRGVRIPESEMRKDPVLWFENCLRFNLKLGDKDYELLITIEKNLEGGWCFLSKEELAKNIELSRSNAVIHLNKLISKGLVERHKKITQILKLTQLWYQTKEKYKNAR